jgi:hypothetical protein
MVQTPERRGKGMTIRKLGFVCALALGLAMSATSAFALGPVKLIDASALAQQDLLDASFFGRPYPYGYTGWGPCVRYVEVEGRYGPRLRRVWACH